MLQVRMTESERRSRVCILMQGRYDVRTDIKFIRVFEHIRPVQTGAPDNAQRFRRRPLNPPAIICRQTVAAPPRKAAPIAACSNLRGATSKVPRQRGQRSATVIRWAEGHGK